MTEIPERGQKLNEAGVAAVPLVASSTPPPVPPPPSGGLIADDDPVVGSDDDDVPVEVDRICGAVLKRWREMPDRQDYVEMFMVAAATGAYTAGSLAGYRAGREDAARDILDLPYDLGDEGWDHLERQAKDAGWPGKWVRDRRIRDDFTTATIESAYQYGYRRAAEVARGAEVRSEEQG